MNYYTDGDIIEVVSLEGGNTRSARTSIGSKHSIDEVYVYSSAVKIGFNKFLDFEDIRLIQRAPETQYTTEQLIAQKAVQSYRELQMDKLRIESILKTKLYHLNDYIVDKNFGVGKIVGWDEEYNYYRVRFNEWSKFIGRKEDILTPYDGPVPQELHEHDPNKVNYVWGFYIDDTETEYMEA